MYKKLFFYKCADCKKKRQTFKEEKVESGVCRPCLAIRVSPNQVSLFGDNRVDKVENNHAG